jgi:protein-S-isoprenylcysteine O-methyltransferase Ste14
MGSMEWLLAAEWVAYGALHSILASTVVKMQLKRRMGKGYRLYRLIYSTLALLLLIPMIRILLFHPSPYLWEPGRVTKVLGICISVTGMILAMYVLRRYLRSPEGFRDLFVEGETPALQTNGLHQWVRHPLYLFTFIVLWGAFLYKPTMALLITNIVITVYTLVAIRFEEKKLLALYGEAYQEYKKNVPVILPRWPF